MNVRATISDSKSDFHKEFPYVIPPIYRKLADELLVELHLLSHQKTFKLSNIFATGLIEIFASFTNGYKPNDHLSNLFNAICNCNGFDPEQIKSLSEDLLTKTAKMSKEKFKTYLEDASRNNMEDNYYSRINAIGIFKLVNNITDYKNIQVKELDLEILELTKILSYPSTRVEKDISLYRSNIEKMKQALEIMELSKSKKK